MFIQEDWDVKIDFNDFNHLEEFRRIYFVILYVYKILLFAKHFSLMILHLISTKIILFIF